MGQMVDRLIAPWCVDWGVPVRPVDFALFEIGRIDALF